MPRIKTFQEYYDIYRDSVVAESDLTDFAEGSIHDILAASFSFALNEVAELLISEFRKTYFDTAEGLNLEGLAVDHFGDRFTRPLATNSTVTIEFSRANTDAGDVVIPVGTVIRTETDAEGAFISFVTLEAVTLTGLTIDANAQSSETGSINNVGSGTLTVIDSSLTDTSVTSTNDASAAGGNDIESDSQYRETIRSLIQSLVGATKEAIRGVLLAVPEIRQVALVEKNIPVIEFDITKNAIKENAEWFRYPNPTAYVADQNGQSSQGLIDKGIAAIQTTKACGVSVEVRGAVVVTINWTVSVTFNTAGPNFTELSNDATKISDTMKEYVNDVLRIGESFVRSAGEEYVLSVWGVAGTNDLTAIRTTLPTGDVMAEENSKIVVSTAKVE